MKASAAISGNAPQAANPVILDTSFPKGQALADWLANLTPGTTYGQVHMDQVFDNFDSVNPALAQIWARSNSMTRTPVQMRPRFMTTNTPVGLPLEQQCGKAVHLDAHVINSDLDKIDVNYPNACTGPFTVGQQAFAFFFFDLASCIQKEDAPVVPPPPK
jgi:hypothetical protein